MNEREGYVGLTDQPGVKYTVLRSPDDGPPITLAFQAPKGRRWNRQAEANMVGQGFAITWNGRPHQLRIVGSRINAETGHLEVYCT